jgi:hypothetical protein
VIRSFARRAAVFVAVGVAVGAFGCGAGQTFKLSSGDNDPAAVTAALARGAAPTAGPVNKTGKPLALLVARGTPKQLIAFDLAAKKPLWKVPADVTSKVVIGGGFVAHLEGEGTLVGRDVATGAELWRRPVGGTRFVGAAADAERVYYTAEDKAGGKPSWTLYGLDGVTGKELWAAGAEGALGAPAARGGLVYSPFLKQWLSIVDGKTGEQLTRIRATDEEITIVRAGADGVFFGSSSGVVLLDERAASGKRSKSTFGKTELPKELARSTYGADAFDPVQAGYSAYDRNRVLWRAAAKGEALEFAGDRVVAVSFRFFFGFGAADGKLAWAYSHPRVDVVGSAHLGGSIGFASMLGELGALDPATGRRTYAAKVDGQLIGVSFDADGFAPDEQVGETTTTAEALTAIAKDRDARFIEIKKYAIGALATLEGGGSTKDLVAMVTDERTPTAMFEAAVDSLVARRDPKGMPTLIEAISIPYDHLATARPRAVGALARAMGGMAGLDLEPAVRGKAIDALMAKLESPELPADDLTEVIGALGALGQRGELDAITSFLLLYRADPAMAGQPGPVTAAIDVLVAHGGGKGREVVAYVAADPRSDKALATHARRALLKAAKADVELAPADGAKPTKKAK